MKKTKKGSYTKKYIASLRLLGVTYTAKGKTALESIYNLEPKAAKGVGVLSVTRGKTSREKILGRPLVYGLFGEAGKLRKDIAVKQISMLFDKM